MAQKILIVEDDPAFRKTVSAVLSRDGYAVAEAGTGREGMLRVVEDKPDLIILDLVLPGLRGMEVCERVKRHPQTAGIPILILTGNDREGQDIACLDVGADDYLTKPVKTERLLAHCRALLRRSGPEPAAQGSAVAVGALELDFGRKLAVFKGKEYPHLTPKEFGLLFDLAVRGPEPQDRAALYRRVWGMEPPSEGSLKTVDVHVRRVRLKMGWGPEEWLVFVHGRGYCLRKEA